MDQRKVFSVSAELAAQIDDYRFANRIPSESEAIRRLIEKGLQAQAEAEKLKKGRGTG